MYVQFGASGQSGHLSIIQLPGSRLEKQSQEVVVKDAAGRVVELETFANDRVCTDAYERLTRAIRRKARLERWGRAGAGISRYGVWPLGLMFIALALNLALHAALSRSKEPLTASSLTASQDQPRDPPAVIRAPYQRPSAVSAGDPAIPADSIAKGLALAVSSGKFAVQLGPKAIPGASNAVYVFEDPLCSHCRELAPELAKLAKENPVYVFPVTVVGQADSEPLAASSLCAPEGGRASIWEKALQGGNIAGPGKPVPALRPECLKAVEANNEIFAKMQLLGTPTIFDQRGRMYPIQADMTANAIAAWVSM